MGLSILKVSLPSAPSPNGLAFWQADPPRSKRHRGGQQPREANGIAWLLAVS
jgi:hypothetical protein